jgi:hypothetical protein
MRFGLPQFEFFSMGNVFYHISARFKEIKSRGANLGLEATFRGPHKRSEVYVM